MNQDEQPQLTHLDQDGRLRMVDVGDKTVTCREATAQTTIYLGPKVYPLLLAKALKKGDALAAARLAAILAVKNTYQLIPLCHNIPISGIEVDFFPDDDRQSLEIRVTVRTQAQTGVEMEALTGAAVAALTIYDMCKAVDRSLVIDQLRLLHKSGGKSGVYHYSAP